MSATKPEGAPPRSNETCPLCKAPPNIPHASSCPWLVWADEKAGA